MSSKKAMKLAQKQAYAKHRSNISQNRFNQKKKFFNKNKNKNVYDNYNCRFIHYLNFF